MSFCYMRRETVQEFNEDDELGVKHVIGDMPARRHLRGCQNQNSASGCEICKALATTKPSTHWPYRPGQRVQYRTTAEMRYYARYDNSN